MSNSRRSPAEERPEFMVRLGLLPPYTTEDVQQAYRRLAWKTHPDQGGTSADFVELQHAYERATEYVEFRTNKRKWIAAHAEKYTKLQRVAAELQRLGAAVELNVPNWLERSFGDFAQLTESIQAVRFQDSLQADAVIEYMTGEIASLRGLRSLDLSGSSVSDGALGKLRHFTGLVELNLSRTPAGGKVLHLVRSLPRLDRVNLTGTRVGWLARWRLQRILSVRRKQRPIFFADQK